jgi:hypothetical protein
MLKKIGYLIAVLVIGLSFYCNARANTFKINSYIPKKLVDTRLNVASYLGMQGYDIQNNNDDPILSNNSNSSSNQLSISSTLYHKYVTVPYFLNGGPSIGGDVGN